MPGSRTYCDLGLSGPQAGKQAGQASPVLEVPLTGWAFTSLFPTGRRAGLFSLALEHLGEWKGGWSREQGLD